MARNIEMRERVAGSFSNADSLLYPKTHINMVEGLLTNGKLTLSLLPDGLKTGLKYIATRGTAATTADLLTIITNAATSVGLDSASYPGSFIVTSTAYTLTVSASHVVKGDDGAGEVAAAGTIALDVNDWLVYRGNFATVHNWDVINNTHGLASASVAGLMSTTDKSKLDGIAASANNYSHPTQTAIDGNAADDGINVIDRVQVNTLGHVTSVTTRNLSAATTTKPGHMTADDKSKLDGIANNANNYSHPTGGANVNIAAGTYETINSVVVDTLGHVTAFTKQSIRTGSTTVTGLLQLATGTELTSALSTTKAATPSAVKSTVDYYSGMKRYADLATANAAAHADGAMALITVA